MALGTVGIKWIFPHDECPEICTKVSSYEQLEQKVFEYTKEYQNRVVPFLRQGEAYYHLKKFEEKVRERFRKQINTYQQRELVVQFRYKPEHEQEKYQKLMVSRLEKITREVEQKIDKKEECYYQNLRIQKTLSRVEDETIKNLKIYFMISEPLVKKVNYPQGRKQIYQPILKQQVVISQHKQNIKEAYDNKNWKINLQLEKMHINWDNICIFVQNSERQHQDISVDVVVVQIYTEIYKVNQQLYVSLEDSTEIGLEDKMEIRKFLQQIAQIYRIGLIILVAVGGMYLKQVKSSYFAELSVPIISIPVFDCEKDILFKDYFLKSFYENLFKRRSIEESFQKAEKYIKDNSFIGKSLCNCCCMHKKSHQKEAWNNVTNIIGNFTAHKIFHHYSRNEYRNEISKPNLTKQITKFLLGASQVPKCYSGTQNHNLYRQIKLFKKDNISQSFLFPTIQNKEKEQSGLIKNDKVKQTTLQRFRPKLQYQMISKITKARGFHLFHIKGSSKSGKSEFIDLIYNYITERQTCFKFVKLFQWAELSRNNLLIDRILSEVKKVKKDGGNKKIIINFAKVNYNVSEEYEKMIVALIENPVLAKQNVIVLAALGQSNSITKRQILEHLTELSIPPASDNQLKYMILRNQKVVLDRAQKIETLANILEAFKVEKDIQIDLKNEKNFTDFCTILSKMISSVSQRKGTIADQIKKLIHKTPKVLDDLKILDNNLWNLLGFICTFKQPFYISEDFNERFLNKKQTFNKLLDLKNKIPVRLYRKLQYPYKRFSIQAEPKCYNYFSQFRAQFLNKKITYFFNFYYNMFQIIKKGKKDLKSQNVRRVIERLGIFSIQIDERLQEVLTHNPSIFVNVSNSKDIKQFIDMQARLLKKNMMSFIQFLAQFNHDQTPQNFSEAFIDQEHILLVYTIYYAVITQVQFGHAEKEDMQMLKQEITNFIQSWQSSKIDLNFHALISQIRSLLIIQPNKNGKQISDDRRQYVTNLQCYQLILNKTKKIKQREKEQTWQNLISYEKIMLQIEEVMRRLEGSLQKIQGNSKARQKKYQLYECIINLIIIKILIKFKLHNQEQKLTNKYLEIEDLERDLNYNLKRQSNIKDARENVKRENSNDVIAICQAFLKLKNFHSYDDSGIPRVNEDILSPDIYQIYQYIKHKLNPRTLFESKNIALFMKPGCLRVEQSSYNFVRINNIISSLLSEQLSTRNVNLLFMNFSTSNFEKIVEVKPVIDYFFLSVDCRYDQKCNLEVLVEDSETLLGKFMSQKLFSNSIKKIRCKFLIIFGSYSKILSEKLQNQLNPETLAVISFTLNRNPFDLSTLPDIKVINKQKNAPFVIENFIKIENSQRRMIMILCSLITTLVKDSEKNGKEVTKKYLEQICKNAIQVSDKIVRKWYEKRDIEDLLYAIQFNVLINFSQTEKKTLPYVEPGSLKNITSKVIPTPNNFNPDFYYQNIGRTQIIVQVMRQLKINNGKKIVQIRGGSKSGKTCLLKQIGWFCMTRDMFPLGVFFYNVKTQMEENRLSSIKKEIDKEYSSKKRMLILLDDLQPNYFSINKKIFQEFLNKMQSRPIYLVYTVKFESRKRLQENEILANQTLEQSLPKSLERQKIHSVDINKLECIEKLCIALVNIRNRGPKAEKQIFEQSFQSLFNMDIRKQVEASTYTKIGNKKGHKKHKKLDIKKIKSSTSIKNEYLQLGQKPVKNKSQMPPLQSGFFDDFQRKISEKDEGGSQSDDEQEDELKSSQSPGSTAKKINNSQKKNKSDLKQILEQCQNYKRQMKKVNELTQEEIYKQSYLQHDISFMRKQLQFLQGGKTLEIKAKNPIYFKIHEYYQ